MLARTLHSNPTTAAMRNSGGSNDNGSSDRASPSANVANTSDDSENTGFPPKGSTSLKTRAIVPEQPHQPAVLATFHVPPGTLFVRACALAPDQVLI
jgi:hypothetical protein